MFFAELFAHPVHPAPQQNGQHQIQRVFHGTDQRLPKHCHHGNHHTLAQQHGNEIALFVKVRDAKGQMHKGAWREGQQREHEQRRSVKAVHPLLSLFQLGRAGGKLPEEALDHPPPEQEHDAATQRHTGPAVQKTQNGRQVR